MAGVLNRGVAVAQGFADGGDVVYRPLVRWAVRDRVREVRVERSVDDLVRGAGPV